MSYRSFFLSSLFFFGAVFSGASKEVALDTLEPMSVIEAAFRDAASGSSSDLMRIGRQGGEGSWFALGVAADGAGYPEIARKMRNLSIRRDPSPFFNRSLMTLLKEDPLAIDRPLLWLASAQRKYGDDEDLRRARIAIFAAKGRRRGLSREMEEFQGKPWEAPVLNAALDEKPDEPHRLAVLERFILHSPDPGALAVFPEEFESALLRARKFYAAGSYDEALNSYAEWLDEAIAGENPCDWEASPPFFGEIAGAALRTGNIGVWAEALSTAAVYFKGSKRYGAAYQAGRLYRAAGNLDAASRAFLVAAGAVPSGLERDRAMWQRWSLLYDAGPVSPEEEMEVLSWTSGSWSDPHRFSDHLDEFLHRRVRAEQWEIIENAYLSWGSYWPGFIRSQAALILVFAISEGRIVSQYGIEEYLKDAFIADPLSWYGLRAAGILGRLPKIPDASLPSELGNVSSSDDQIGQLLIRWGMAELLVADILSNPNLYSDETIRMTAQALSDTKPRTSIRIIGLLARRPGYRIGRNDLYLRHPLPLGDLPGAKAEQEGIPPHIFYGLIRTESAWDIDALSRSGAQGLAQFMPATWEEWVNRMRYPVDADPMDPEVNLSLGAAYLSWLVEREWTFGWVDVLASYNAGGGRVRTWRWEWPGLGEDLFGISIPLEEPRSYVRKVLSAATLYGYLYSDLSPRELHSAWGLEMEPGVVF